MAPATLPVLPGESSTIQVHRAVWPITSVLFLIAFAAVTGLLRSTLLLAVGATLALALPIARDLSRRVVIVGASALGFIPLLWWVPLPGLFPSHASVLVIGLALALGVLVVTTHGEVLRDLVPRLHSTDVAWAFGSLLTTAMAWPQLQTTIGPIALSRLLRGWDHSAHFAMAEMIRTHGVVVPLIQDGALGTWSYKAYPQGYHTVVSTITEAVIGSRVVPPDQAIVVYTIAAAWVGVLAVVVLLAGIVSLQSLRGHPILAVPLVTAVAGFFAFGRGALIFLDGFPNFLVAVAMVALLPILAVQMRTVTVPMSAAVVGAMVAVVQNWALLLVVAVAAVLPVLVPFRRSRWRLVVGRRGGGGLAVTAVIGLFGLGTALFQLAGQPALTEIVVIGGGIAPVPSSHMALTTTLIVVGSWFLYRNRTRLGCDRWQPAVLVGAAVTVAGWGVIAAIHQIQAGTPGGGDYYLVKFAVAFLLILTTTAVVITATFAEFFPRFESRTAFILAGTVTGATVLGFGWPTVHVPAPLGSLGVTPSSGSVVRFWYESDVVSPSSDATTILLSSAAYQKDPNGHVLLLPFPDQRGLDGVMFAQWFDALTGTWTNESQEPLVSVPAPEQDNETAVEVAMATLEKAPGFSVMVGPEFVEAVRSAAAERGWAHRVLTW